MPAVCGMPGASASFSFFCGAGYESGDSGFCLIAQFFWFLNPFLASHFEISRHVSPLNKTPNPTFLFFFFFCFLQQYMQHMEVPRLGVESELQLLTHTTATAIQHLIPICDPHHSLQQPLSLNR